MNDIPLASKIIAYGGLILFFILVFGITLYVFLRGL